MKSCIYYWIIDLKQRFWEGLIERTAILDSELRPQGLSRRLQTAAKLTVTIRQEIITIPQKPSLKLETVNIACTSAISSTVEFWLVYEVKKGFTMKATSLPRSLGTNIFARLPKHESGQDDQIKVFEWFRIRNRLDCREPMP